MPGRNVEDGQYRYKYQGQEKDPETGMEAFELRLWDSRIGRWLTTDPKGEFHSPYLGMGNNPISLTDPDGGQTDDWVRGKDGDTWVWREDITSKEQATAAGLQYGGATRADVIKNWGFNITAGFEGWWNRNLGGGHGQKFNMNSFYDAKFNAVSRRTISAEKSREFIQLTSNQIEENKTLWTEDKHQPYETSFNIGIDFLKTSFRDYDFEFSMDVNGETIFGDAAFSKTNKSIQYFTKVTEGKFVPQGVFTGHSNTSLLLGNSTKTGVIIINFRTQADYHKISNYLNN